MEDQAGWHGKAPDDAQAKQAVEELRRRMVMADVKQDQMATRSGLRRRSCRARNKRIPNIIVMDADLSKSTMTAGFKKEFPERFFNAGIAEANLMGMAAGLALSGKTVFASTFAMFAAGRAYEIIRNSIGYTARKR